MIDFLGPLEDLEKDIVNLFHKKEVEPVSEPIATPKDAVEEKVIVPTPSVVVPTPLVLVKQNWPTQAECPIFYGNPADPNWLHNNTISVTCPWELHMEKVVLNHILIHKKCAASLTRILNYIWEQCDKSQAKIEALHYDQYSGSYNFRPIRGSTHGVLSVHSFAAAIDWDADENEQHSLKHLFTDDSLLVKAFKAEGAIWGGDWSPGSIDSMHVQFARVK